MNFFNPFQGKNKANEIKQYLDNGAIVLDVRTTEEFEQGHVENSTLITLNDLPNHIETIKSWQKPVVIVCKSGGRAETALNFLEQHGIEAINGGAWQNAVV